MTEPVKVGVIGVGYLGRFHAEKYAALAETELVGVAEAWDIWAGFTPKSMPRWRKRNW